MKKLVSGYKPGEMVTIVVTTGKGAQRTEATANAR